MADVILEWTFDVSGYAKTFISRGEIIIFRGESVRNKWKTRKNKIWQNLSMVPPLEHFQGENKNCLSLDKRISMSRRSFLAKLTTFGPGSGQKFLSFLKIAIFKMGGLITFQSHRSWGDTILVWGWHKRPITKMEST